MFLKQPTQLFHGCVRCRVETSGDLLFLGLQRLGSDDMVQRYKRRAWCNYVEY